MIRRGYHRRPFGNARGRCCLSARARGPRYPGGGHRRAACARKARKNGHYHAPGTPLGGDPRLAAFRLDDFYPPERFDGSLSPRKTFDSDRSGPELERLLAGMKSLLTDYHIDGFYLDGTQMPRGGAGSVRRARELMKRMRYLVDRYGTRGVIHAHTSAFNIVPVNAFRGCGLQRRAVLGRAGAEGPREARGSASEGHFMLVMNGPPWGIPHDLCQDRPELVDFARLLNTGTDTYQWSDDRWPIRRLWLDADLWHAKYTPPEVATARWPDAPSDVYVSYYESAQHLHTVIVYNAQAQPAHVRVPVQTILGLRQDQELTAPTVALSRSAVQ